MTLEELLKTGLKKTDLIWIEGKSAAWSFPAEIEHLKAHLPGQEVVSKTPEPALATPDKAISESKIVEAVGTPPSSVRVDVPAQSVVPTSRLVHVILPKPKAVVDGLGETIIVEPVSDEKIGDARSKAGSPDNRSRLSAAPAATQKTLFPVEAAAVSTVNIEEKAEALRNKILAFDANKTTAGTTAPANDKTTAAPLNIEEKAEAIRNRILAFNAQKNVPATSGPAGVDIASAKDETSSEPLPIEDKAEILKAKIAAIRAAQQVALSESLPAANAVIDDETHGIQTSIEDKAEAIRKKIAAYNAEKQASVKQTSDVPATSSTVTATSRDPMSPPAPDLDEKAEELRRKIAAYNLENRSKKAATSFTAAMQPDDGPALETKYAKPLTEIEEEYASWTFSSKTKKKTLIPEKRVFVIGLGVLLLAGIFGIGKYAYDKTSSPNAGIVTDQQVTDTAGAQSLTASDEEKPVIKSNRMPEELVRSKPVPDKTVSNNIEADRKNAGANSKIAEAVKNAPQKANAEPVITKADHVEMERLAKKMVLVKAGKTKFTVKEMKNMARLKMTPVTLPNKKKPEPAPENVVLKIPTAPPAVKTADDKSVQKNAEITSKPAPVIRKPSEVAAESPATKKTFSDRVDDFFGQFKKKEEPKQSVEEPVKGTTDGQQKAAPHREDEAVAPAPAAINLVDQVDVTSSDPPESFLMGIHGLKVTLNNKSDHTVKSASVEVRYYNEDKELLEKKIVMFTNVPPKKRITMPAPDHRLAAHADTHLLAASGN